MIARSRWFAARPSGIEAVYEIYVESSDPWANPQLFLFDEQHRRRFVGNKGLPDDRFWHIPVLQRIGPSVRKVSES